MYSYEQRKRAIDLYIKYDSMYFFLEYPSRGYLGNHFLKDLFEATYVPDIEYVCIAVRKEYQYKRDGVDVPSYDYSIIKDNYLKPFIFNGMVTTKLKTILLIGY